MTTPAPPTPVYGRVAPPPRRFFPKWLIALGVILLLAVLWKCGSALYEGRRLANAFAQDFHQKLNNGQFEDIYSAADDGFTRSGRHEDLVNFFENVHAKLGNAGKQSLVNLRINATTNGTFLIAQYNSIFDRGRAVETFTFVKSGNSLRLYGYNIQSDALVAK